MKIKIVFVLTLVLQGLYSYGQDDFENKIAGRIIYKLKQTYPSISRFDILRLDYGFENKPEIIYDLINASYIPTTIDLKHYKFPNCTQSSQSVNETFSTTVTEKKTVSFLKTDVSTDKLTIGVRVPIKGAEISLSDETINTTTIQNGITTEKTEVRTLTRNTPFTIPANKTTLIKLETTIGILRVYFNASCTINGRVRVRMHLGNVNPGGGSVFKDVNYDISNLLDVDERKFHFQGFVESNNSSDLIVSFAEREVNPNLPGECIESNSKINSNDPSKAILNILDETNIKYSESPLRIEVGKEEKLVYKIINIIK